MFDATPEVSVPTTVPFLPVSEYLTKRHWVRGVGRRATAKCLWVAIEDAYGVYSTEPKRRVLEAIKRYHPIFWHFCVRDADFRHDGIIIQFNDFPGRSFRHIQRVIREARV